MSETLRDAIQSILPEIIELRHELHRHPEIRFEERWTSDGNAAEAPDEEAAPQSEIEELPADQAVELVESEDSARVKEPE